MQLFGGEVLTLHSLKFYSVDGDMLGFTYFTSNSNEATDFRRFYLESGVP